MSNRGTQNTIFALRYLATQKRNVGSAEISKVMGVHRRTAQHILKRLVEAGVAECDSSSPKGYKFTGLELTENKKP